MKNLPLWQRVVLCVVLVIAYVGIQHFSQPLPAPALPHPTPEHQAQQHTPSASTDHDVSSIVAYIKTTGHLPDFYLTKHEASLRGWVPSRGNLADVAPGMMIGGDVFTNSEHLLPAQRGRVWHEADIGYTGGTRGPQRILYSNDGLVYVTYDHYKTVTQQ